MARNNRLSTHPETVAELGPGNSLGVGLAALLSGAECYFAFDVVERADPDRNTTVMEELAALFRAKAAIPGEDEFPGVKPYLDNYDFPADILSDERLGASLREDRLERIRAAIREPRREELAIRYKPAWYGEGGLENESVDMIFSQAVLEHVEDLRGSYRSMHGWLKPFGFVSHQIDFKSHGTSTEWNGHWTHSDFIWALIKGKRPYLLNREPHSAHLRILQEQGYRVVCDQKIRSESRISRDDLAPRFRRLSDDDLTTSGTFIQAVKAV